MENSKKINKIIKLFKNLEFRQDKHSFKLFLIMKLLAA